MDPAAIPDDHYVTLRDQSPVGDVTVRISGQARPVTSASRIQPSLVEG
jgi:hypothetical protein